MSIIGKKLLLTIFAILSVYITYGQCPIYGNTKDEKNKELNIKKNRSVNVSKKTVKIQLDSILKSGNDISRFNDSMYIEIIGYVYEIVPSGKESCNCDSINYMNTDIHIYVGKKDAKSKDECFIVEVSPKSKKKLLKQFKNNSDWKTLESKKVKFTGYMLFDVEHKGNAENTCKKCTNIWRKTCWEIHPVTKVTIVK